MQSKRNIGDVVIRRVQQQLQQVDVDSPCGEAVRNAFEEFRKAWENVVPLVNAAKSKDSKEMPFISEREPVGYCLVEKSYLGGFLCNCLAVLADMQNEFLDKCLSVAASSSCPALQFLSRKGSVCSFPSVHVQDAKEKEIILYQWTDKLLDHSQYNTEYGHGTEIIYDIAKIEKDLAGLFLLGKAYLTTSGGLREFVFSKNLFHDCANILNDLNQAIPQEKLPNNVEAELSSSASKSLDRIQMLLEHMEIVLCFLKRTGGKPEESLINYVETWMSTSRPFPKELLHKTQTAIQLRHVCALYELLEDKLSVAAADSVVPDYRTKISEACRTKMDRNDNLEDEGRSLNLLQATVTATKRFIFRYLNMKPQPGDCLVELMYDPSLWPMGLRTQRGDFEFRVSEVVPTLFPKMLTIAHVYEVHKYYQDRHKKVGLDQKYFVSVTKYLQS